MGEKDSTLRVSRKAKNKFKRVALERDIPVRSLMDSIAENLSV